MPYLIMNHYSIGFQLPDFSLSNLGVSKEFTKPVYFNGSQFFGKEILSNGKFQQVSFHKTDFHQMLFFKKTIFQGQVDFSEANFQGQVDFNEANFKVKSDFTFANFQVAYFIKANFEGEVIFTGCSFFGRTYFTHPFNNETKFNYVVFEGKEKIIFNIENLSNVSFMNTDVTGVRFSDNARWRGEGGGINVDNIIRKLE